MAMDEFGNCIHYSITSYFSNSLYKMLVIFFLSKFLISCFCFFSDKPHGTEFLETVKEMTLKELKDAGILIKVGEQLCPKKLNGNDVYKHTGTGDLITLTSDFELVGRNRKDNDKIEKLLENENIKDLGKLLCIST